MSRLTRPIPPDYTTPAFPSLYWPFGPSAEPSAYLYHSRDVWRFTLFWTLIIYEAFHLTASTYAVAVQWKQWKLTWVVPIIFIVVGGVEAILAGTIVGLILGAVFNAGNFLMSTWIPFLWGVINVLVLILSSFSIQGGL